MALIKGRIPCEERKYKDRYRPGFLIAEDEVISGMPPFDPKRRSNGDCPLWILIVSFEKIIMPWICRNRVIFIR